MKTSKDLIDEKIRKVELRQHELEEKERQAEIRKAQQDFERQATIKAEQDAKEKAGRDLHDRMQREAAEDKEKQRKAAMAPDREKLNDWIQSFNSPGQVLILKTKEAKEIYRIAWEGIDAILEEAMTKIQEL